MQVPPILPGIQTVQDEDKLSNRVIGLAIAVHRNLGPGLLESVYEDCLCLELSQAGVPFQRQAASPMVYKDLEIPKSFRADVLVGESLLLEIKAVNAIVRVHEMQALT